MVILTNYLVFHQRGQPAFGVRELVFVVCHAGDPVNVLKVLLAVLDLRCHLVVDL